MMLSFFDRSQEIIPTNVTAGVIVDDNVVINIVLIFGQLSIGFSDLRTKVRTKV